MALLRQIEGETEGVTMRERESIMDEIELRLLIIRIKLRLISETELKAMVLAREAEIQRRLDLQEELCRRQTEDFRQAIIDLIAEETEARLNLVREVRESMYDSIEAEKHLLHAGLMLPSNTYKKVNLIDLGHAIRGYLWANDYSLICYLDGSIHPSIEELDTYAERLSKTMAKNCGNDVKLPNFHLYLTNDVYLTRVHMENCRKKLHAYRCRENPEFASRLRKQERHDALTAVNAEQNAEVPNSTKDAEPKEEVNVNELISQLEEATSAHHKTLEAYNLTARNCSENLFAQLHSKGYVMAEVCMQEEKSVHSESEEDITEGGRYLLRLTDAERKQMYHEDRFLVTG